MRVILRENIENLGKKGDIVNVAPGYGRNYLIPKKIAVEVTSRNMKMIEIEQKALQKGLEKEMASYQEIINRLNAVTLSFTRKTSEKDVIFGSVSSTDIRDALAAQGFDVEKKKILLDEPIKRLGNYSVAIKIFHEERAEIKLEVIKEGKPGIKEDKKPGLDLVEEGAAPEPVEEEEELSLAEEKKEDESPPDEEKSQDAIPEVKEEPRSEPDTVEDAPEEKKGISEATEEIPQESEAILEETKERPEEIKVAKEEAEDKPEKAEKAPDEVKETPEEAEEAPEEAEEPEVLAETQVAESEKKPVEKPSLEEAVDSTTDTSTSSDDSEETTEDRDSKETASKDNK